MAGICKHSRCDDDAVAVQLVRLDPPELLEDNCRKHHVDARRAAGALETVEVTTNRAAIMGVDGSENKRGAVIELDREEIDIDMLVRLGFVKRIATTPDEELAQARAESAALEAQLAKVREREVAAQAAKAEEVADPAPPVASDKPAAKPVKKA
jgi:hypothetical protein